MRRTNKKKLMVFVSIGGFLILGLFYFMRAKVVTPSTRTPAAHSEGTAIGTYSEAVSTSERVARVLHVSEEVVARGKALLMQPLGESPIDKKAHVYLNKIMADPMIYRFFNYTLGFFGPQEGAYSAARFVALMMVFDNSPEKIHLMGWTRGEIEKHSESLMSTLEQKREGIFVNPHFHNRMLNLVNWVKVTPERKLEFFADTIAKPLSVDSTGNLSEASQVMEVAMILSKHNAADPSLLAPVVARSLASNKEPAQKLALQERVLNYYPELDYLFR